MSNPIQGTPIPIWNDNPGSISGSTIFRFYDNEQQFQLQGPAVAKFVARRLGFPISNIELDSGSIYMAFEEAISTYGSELYYQSIKDNYFNMHGNSSTTSYNNYSIISNLSGQIKISENYGTEAGVGGNITYYTGSINLETGVQDYDLNIWASASASLNVGDSIEIRRIFYEKSPAAMRWFDPMSGIGLPSLLGSFGFNQMSPAINTNFLMMPVHFDLQRLQAIEFNDEIRRAGYSFELINNKLRIFPIPNDYDEVYRYKLWFQYIKKSERNSPFNINQPTGSIITNPGNVPYNNITYTEINAPGKNWIRLYTVELCREILGNIREKYSSIPIPGSETTLNGASLITQADNNKLKLIEQLRGMLDETGRTKQLEKQQQEAQNLNNSLAYTPMPIWIF